MVLIGATRLGQEHVRGRALPADRGASPRTSAAALVSDDANDQSATEDAFAVLHEIAGRRLARGPADRGRRHQRPARGARAADRGRPRARPVRGRDRARPARGGLPERNAARPDRDFGAARDPAPARRSCGGRCKRPAARGVPPRRSCCATSRGGRGGRDRARRRCGPTGATEPARSTSSATSTGASTSWSRCSRARLRLRRRDGAPGRAAGGLRRRPRRSRPGRRSTCCGS